MTQDEKDGRDERGGRDVSVWAVRDQGKRNVRALPFDPFVAFGPFVLIHDPI